LEIRTASGRVFSCSERRVMVVSKVIEFVRIPGFWVGAPVLYRRRYQVQCTSEVHCTW
jgi:hypothetical protein